MHDKCIHDVLESQWMKVSLRGEAGKKDGIERLKLHAEMEKDGEERERVGK